MIHLLLLKNDDLTKKPHIVNTKNLLSIGSKYAPSYGYNHYSKSHIEGCEVILRIKQQKYCVFKYLWLGWGWRHGQTDRLSSFTHTVVFSLEKRKKKSRIVSLFRLREECTCSFGKNLGT